MRDDVTSTVRVSPRRQTWIVRTGLVLGSVLIALVLVEIAMRIWIGAPPPFLEPQVRHQSEPYGYKPLPNQRGVFTVDKPVTTNRFGFRDDEWDVPKPRGRTRVLVVGDSFTFGNNNRVEDIYPSVLRRSLMRRFGAQVDVLNASAGGWDLDNEVAFLQMEGFGYEPDVLVVGFYINDVLPPRATLQEAIDAAGRLDARPWWGRLVPYSLVFAVKRSALVSYVRMQAPLVFGKPILDNLLLDNAVDLSTHPAMRNTRQLLATLVDECRRRNVAVVIALIPPVNLYARPRGSVKLVQEIESIARSNGAGFVDLSAPFWSDPQPQRHYGSPWDNHFVASGHALAGAALERAVEPIIASRVNGRGP